MTPLLITLAVGIAVGALILFGIFKGLKMLLVVAVLLALGYLGYMFIWPPKTMVSSERPIFKGPIIIRIEPPANESKAPAKDQNIMGMFKSGKLRDPFQAQIGADTSR